MGFVGAAIGIVIVLSVFSMAKGGSRGNGGGGNGDDTGYENLPNVPFASVTIDFDGPEEPGPDEWERGDKCFVDNPVDGAYYTYDSEGNCVAFWNTALEDIFADEFETLIMDMGVTQEQACAPSEVIEDSLTGDVSVEVNEVQLIAIEKAIMNLYPGQLDPDDVPPNDMSPYFDRIVYARATWVYLTRVCGQTSF